MPSRSTLKGKQLYKVLFFGVIFAVVAVGALSSWGVREVRRDAAAVAVESSARGVAGAVTVLVNAVTRANDEIGNKTLESLKPNFLRSQLGATIKEHPALEGILVSDARGLRFSLVRWADGLLEMIPARDGGEDRWALIDKDGTLRKTSPRSSFDLPAMNKGLVAEFAHLQPGEVNWQSLYRFYSSGEMLLTASALVEAEGDDFMVSYVFPVQAVTSQLGGAEKGSAEKVFLYWTSGKVLPVNGDERLKAMAPEKVADPVVATATSLLADRKPDRIAPFAYDVGGETWWTTILPLSVFGDTMSLGVAVPRRNIVSTLTSDTFLQVFGSVLVLFAAAALLVLYRNRSRIEALGLRARAARTPEDVLHLIAEGESRTLEFKQTLRFNLKAGKNGREIEHASMKSVAGFMNSDGGTLLIGVADNGAITGFEEDRFGSDDKALLHFNNLVNQHIGTEFSRYIDTAIIEVQNKQVLRAHCIPAAAPAILKNGKNEEFYVRSGPASRQLTLSQFYEWLQNH